MYSDMYLFERLLDYELSQSLRHRRYLSLVMLSLKDSRQEVLELLINGLRRSDEVFFHEGRFVVMMGKTSKSEAIRAVHRYSVELEGCLDMRCSVSSFPEDGKTPRELLGVLQNRLAKAMQLETNELIVQ